MSVKRVYNTKQKDVIRKTISTFDDRHFTASDVVKALSDEGVKIGQATVYRLIDRLEADGELRRYIVDGVSAVCYQRTEGSCREHFHLKCENCGRLIHVECEELSRIAEHIRADHSFTVDPSKTVFYGICEDCK